MTYDDTDVDTGTAPVAPAIRQTGPARTKRDALDEFMWGYHDNRHTGSYVMCNGCTEVLAFFADNQKFNIL